MNAFRTLLVAAALLVAASAWAHLPSDNSRDQLSVVQNAVGTPTYDDLGRMVGLSTKRYDAGGRFMGSTEARYAYDASGHLSYNSYLALDADGIQSQRVETEWQLEGLRDGVERIGDRRYYDSEDLLERRELETWRKDPGAPIRTVQTEYFDAFDNLEKSRYHVTERDRTGRIVVRDISLFDAQNVQLSRTYEEWSYPVEERIHIDRRRFDEGDELLDREVENRIQRAGRLQEINIRKLNAEDEVTGYVETFYSYDNGHLVLQKSTHYDAEERAVLRSTVSMTYDDQGRLAARRSTLEYL